MTADDLGIPLTVLPVHVHRDLGLSTVIVGIVAGSQFAASALTPGHQRSVQP